MDGDDDDKEFRKRKKDLKSNYKMFTMRGPGLITDHDKDQKVLEIIIEEMKLEGYVLERKAIDLVKKAKQKDKLYILHSIKA
mmetsp:Transcript_36843/g.35563  ORF Transcript_36843/g.35563 Transcript_36843/m.35563 type:complete len:82 (+) Transcript_36843:104-349(+)